ncbi:MAG: hypothetical protein ACYDC6_01115 [Acidobacteriaceae bacterium]
MRFPPGLTRIGAPTGILLLGLSLAAWASGATTSGHATHSRPVTTSSTGRKSRAKSSLRHVSYRRFSAQSRRHRSRHVRITGQRAMDPQRATEIQQSLIQAHYLNGPPSGQWDAASQAAMVKYQNDNGWQTKITPDSRALIKLGLGPKQDAGEYATAPAGISKSAAPTDAAGTMAASTGSAATIQN